MSTTTEDEFDVAVVGLGPVGSALTALLALRGLRVLAIEQSSDVFALPRAAHIDHMGLRTLQEVGVLDDLLAGMITNPGLEFRSAGGQPLMRIPGDQGSVSGLPASMYFHQPTLDRTLRQRAVTLPGVTSRAPSRLEFLHQDSEGVTVGLRASDGTASAERVRWIVGCDGAASLVRESSKVALEDLGFDERWLVVDLQLPHPIPTLPRQAVHVCDPKRPHTAIPMPDLRYRFELQLAAGEDGGFLQQPGQVARLLSGWLDVNDVAVERAATYTFHGLIAKKWRSGRALIAGDAAHQMPPFLGQGMCSGLRDAANLAWKLSWVIKGNLQFAAASTLLETYEAERRPHVRSITEAVIAFGDVICSRDRAYTAERDARFQADPRPMEQRIPFSLPRLVSGPLVLQGGGRLFGQPIRRIGVPSLDDIVGHRFLVVARAEDDLESASWWRDQLGAVVMVPDPASPDENDRFLGRALDRCGARVIVVRPDRYVMFSGDDATAARDSLCATAGLQRPALTAGVPQ